MAEWPLLDELKQVLDVTSEDWDGDSDNTRLTRLLAAAIAQTKIDIGAFDDMDDPTDAQAQAALRLAELIAGRPDVPSGILTRDAQYRALLKGSRRYFGVA